MLTVHCKSTEAPAKLISTIYTLLTGRELRGKSGDMASTGIDATSEVPPFARPNASSLLSANIKESEMLTTLQDRSTAVSRTAALLDSHSTALRNERENEPGRFQTGGVGTNYGSMLRGPPKPVSQEMESAPVRFQEVKVKAVDRNIAQLRASRDQLAGGYSQTGSSPSVAAPGMVGAPAPQAAVTDVMQLLCDRVVAASLVDATASLDAAFLVFVKSLPDVDVGECTAFFRGVAEQDANELSAASLASPKQGWQLLNALCHALTAVGGSGSDDVFAAIVSLLAEVGARLVDSNANVAQSLMHDFGLPRLLPLLQQHLTHASKMRELLRVLYAFCADTPEAHIDVIRWLQESLEDQHAFLSTLTVLVTLERSFSEDLLDLYVYYCVIALGMPSCRLRAAALGMLPVVSKINYQMGLQMLPRLQPLVDEPWWEVAAGLGRVCCTLLAIPAAATSSEAGALLDILLSVLGNRNPRVLSMVLPECAALLPSQLPLGAPFAGALLGLPTKERAFVLQSAASWPALAVAQALLGLAKEQQLDHLASAHAEVLLAVLRGALAAADSEQWVLWLKANKDYLYVGLCDEDLCSDMSRALLLLFGLLQDLALPTFATLFSSLRMLSGPEGHRDCQAQADILLTSLLRMGAPFAGAVSKLVAEFEPSMRIALPGVVQLVEA